jgi:HK97 family phage major capsid protein
MAVTLEEIKKGVDEIGVLHTQFKSEFETFKTNQDTLIKEKMVLLSEELGKKHEEVQRELDGIKAREAQRRDPENPEDRKLNLVFAKHRQDFQSEHVKNGNEKQFPDFTPEAADYKKYVKVFWKAVRTSQHIQQGISLNSLTPEEQKDMAVGSDPDGGYFVAPPTIADTVVRRIFETSPMRELASSRNIGTREYVVPEDPSDVGVGWVGERQTRTTTQTINPSRKIIPAQEEYAEPAITQQLLEDSMFDMEAYLSDKLSDKFSRWENAAFVNGTGVNMPRGFMTYPTQIILSGDFNYWNQLEQINSGQNGAFTYTGLVKLITSLKEPFQQNACFLIRRQSLYHVMVLTDANGRLIFQPILNGQFDKTPLLGYPLRYATDMPDASAGSPVTGVNAMAFGDFRQGYQIVDRVGLSMIRDNITAKGSVLIYTRKRVGGDVINFDAIKIHSLAA